jgi:aminomethyltransferase
VTTMPFLSCAQVGDLFITRSGYTGEDGFEISVANSRAVELAERLLAEPEVQPIGLGARDTLRLEAGLCLYGHDIDETTTPVAAGLAWTIGKRRRAEGGFPGAARILEELADPPARRRVGIRPDGRAPAREGSAIVDPEGNLIGEVTSGGFGPSLGAPIAMGYVGRRYSDPGTPLAVVVRDVARPARVAPMPFVLTRYYRAP